MDSDSSDDYYTKTKKAKVVTQKCPYLGTVNRYLLDFDFEKVCSVTLSNANVYACLVCGQYFKGRGKGTPAFIHSLDKQHNVFLNVTDEKVYCLADDYEICDDSLDDIKFNLNPKIVKVDDLPSSALSLSGVEYHPGIVGLNGSSSTSHITASLHALAVIVPLCNLVLRGKESAIKRLIKKMWNYQNFKGVVSPQEFIQHLNPVPSDAMQFLKVFLPSVVPETLVKCVSLDLPPITVFIGEDDKFINTMLLTELLSDIEGDTEYIVIQLKRFVENDFFREKNRTIVRFPLSGLLIGDTQYSLVSMICHEGEQIESGSRPDCSLGKFVAYVCQPKTGQWFNCDGLKISKVLSQSVVLVESYIQIWKRER